MVSCSLERPNVKLSHLVTDIRKMTDAELLERVRQIRHSKYVERPAAEQRKKKPAKQEQNRAVMKLNRMMRDMTDADRAALVKLLEQGAE